MHDKEHKGASYEDICELKKRLIKIVESEFNTSDISSIDAKELGEVVDMIKDFAEAEKYCQEACYYQSIVEAMDDAKEEERRMGYSPRTRMRMVNKYLWDDDDYRMPNPEMRSMRMGYPSRSDSSRDGSMDRSRDSMGCFTSSGRSGYDGYDEDRDDRYGRAYNEFRKARRHYTETKSMADKQMMDEHANEHLADSMQTLKEIWEASDPTLRKKMKADLQKFSNDLPA